MRNPGKDRGYQVISPDLEEPDFFTGVGEEILTVLC